MNKLIFIGAWAVRLMLTYGLFAVGFVFLVGSPGALEHDNITFIQACVQIAIAVISICIASKFYEFFEN
jgi:hypothetical protein